MSASSKWLTSRVLAVTLVGLAAVTGALVSSALDGWDWIAVSGYLLAGTLVVWVAYHVLDRLERRVDREEADRRHAEQHLQTSESKFKTLFESSTDAVVWLDEAGFLGNNRVALRMFGCEKDDQFVGRHPAEFSPPRQPCGTDSAVLIQQHYARAIEDGNHGFEWEHVRRDGKTFSAFVIFSLLVLDGRQLVQAMIRDVTEERRNEAELQVYRNNLEELVIQRTEDVRKANTELRAEIAERERAEHALRDAMLRAEAASEAKSEFLANMSHEIRTPLNGVIGMADLLVDSSLPPEQAEYVEGIRVSGSQLLGLINDILDFSKIEAGMLDLEIVEFDPRQTTEEALENLALEARTKGVGLSYEVDPELPERLEGDPTRLRQVLTNLLSNAVKFTHQGEVVVKVDLLEDYDHLVICQFRVQDTGVGIPRERLQSIFSSFTQADGSTTRKYGGTGLGLTISKRLVTLMEGVMEVDSEPGRGSTFFFTLPLARASKKAEPTVEKKNKPLTTLERPLRILLVEDNRVNQKVALRTLKRHFGLDADVAADGVEALEALTRDEYDLVLMDCQMPRMDGYEATGRIRSPSSKVRDHDIPIIAMTANAMRGDREKCLKAGMNGYVSKPIAAERLGEAIRECLSGDTPSTGAA